MDPVKVEGVDGWKPPKNLMELQGFTGFINFYHHFTKGFSKIAKPLNTLKRLICKEPVLLMPNLEAPFKMEVDMSSFAIGATLSQQDEQSHWHPIAYFSKTLSKVE